MKRIRLDDAIDMIRNIEDVLVPVGYHVGLRGSVLLKGESENDLDIIVYPHDSTNADPRARIAALERLGMRRTRSIWESWLHWGNKGSRDGKMIEIWDWNGIVVDVLIVGGLFGAAEP
jgi:hypothetical protein